MRVLAVVAVLCLLLAPFSYLSAAPLRVTATTTLSQETGNNTSAADTFVTSINGNLGAANISKESIRSLLYPGATTGIYAHTMLWWGSSSHIDIGYNSQDPAQIRRQVQDMISRGLDGAVLDWYGPGHFSDLATQEFISEAEANPGFQSIVEIEHGAVKWFSCYPTCTATTAVINLTKTALQKFAISPSYRWVNGKAVFMEFGMELLSGGVDWNAVQAAVPNVLWIHRNTGGYTKAQSGGAFAWMEPQTLDVEPPDYDGLPYLKWFYQNAVNYQQLQTYGSVYKGFNDVIASWAPTGGRHIEQLCGQTWLRTFSAINQWYSPARPLQNLQLVTWNDYEEGTELESGIDNCLSLAASLNGTQLQWSLSGTGSESTIHHYTVFASVDGQNLMPLVQMNPGSYSVDLASFQLAPANYTLYVKATGQPSIRNLMSNPVSFSVPNQAPVANLSLTPNSGTAPLVVTASTAASTDSDGWIASSAIDFGDGTVMSGSPASHSYSKPGTYTVRATVTDDLGATASSAAAVNISASTQNQPPVARLAITNGSGVGPLKVTASAAGSTDPDGTITKYTLNFGNGYVASTSSGSYTYNLPGKFTVTATVTDDKGATSSSTGTVNVYAGVGIATPAAGTAVSSQFAVSAWGFSSKPVTSMAAYIDGVRVYSVPGSKLDATLTAKSGSHVLEVRMLNAEGTTYKASRSFTVK